MIPQHHRTNFKTMMRAADDGNLALMECNDAKTGEPVFTVCMVGRAGNGDYVFTPVAKMFDGNPYEELTPTMSQNNDPSPIIKDARYAKDKKAVQCPSPDKFKTRAARLSEHLNAYFSGREKAYIMSRTKAERLVQLFNDGWDASVMTGKLIPPKDTTL